MVSYLPTALSLEVVLSVPAEGSENYPITHTGNFLASHEAAGVIVPCERTKREKIIILFLHLCGHCQHLSLINLMEFK